MGVFDRFRKKKITDPWDDAWLAEPHVYKSPEGAAFCAFALTEGTDTILPESPKYSAEGKELTDYRLVLVSTSKDGKTSKEYSSLQIETPKRTGALSPA